MNKQPFLLLGDMSAETFMTEYWQKKPCLFKGAFSSIVKTLPDANELSGLALEPDIESRLIEGRPGIEDDKVKVTQGPFSAEKIENLSDTPWSLLIQSVDIWDETIASLLAQVNFIPRWRIDDVMVSIASKNGGVGPHRDQYDVFLIQSVGTKIWTLAPPSKDKEYIVDNLLKLMPPFSKGNKYIVEESDVLYIPPGWLHWGTAEDLNVTYSIGFRTPDINALVDSLAEILSQASKSDPIPRFSDPWRERKINNALNDQDVDEFNKLLQNILSDKSLLMQALARQASLPKIEASFSEPLDSKAIQNLLDHITEWQFRLNLSAKLVYFVRDKLVHIFVNGEELLQKSSVANLEQFAFILDNMSQHDWVMGKEILNQSTLLQLVKMLLKENLLECTHCSTLN